MDAVLIVGQRGRSALVGAGVMDFALTTSICPA